MTKISNIRRRTIKMAPFIELVALFVLFLSSCHGILRRYEVSNAKEKSAICNDGSNSIFYMERTMSLKWVIFLESGGACFNFDSCTERMLKEPYLTGTQMYPMFITGEDILSSEKGQNFAYDFNKVLIPYCSSDLWLGNATIRMKSIEKYRSIFFRGYQIFLSVLQDLDGFGLRNASSIIIAGSSAGGIGVLNQARFMRNNYKANISVIVDSSWFINYNNMLSGRHIQAFVHGIIAGDLKACFDRVLDYPCCLSAFCMITKHHFPSDVQLFALISRHDIYVLSKGIIGHGQLISQVKTHKIISDMLSFSGEISHSVRLVKTFRNVHTIVTSCFQHAFLATSSLWSPGGLFYARSQTALNFPLFVFLHSVTKERWNQVIVQGQTIRNILGKWYDYYATSRAPQGRNSTTVKGSVADACHGIQCNPTCPRSITFQSKATEWPVWSQWSVLIAYMLITLTCLFIKVFWIAKRMRERRIQDEFIVSLYNGCNILKAIGLPCCIPSNYIGISCMDVCYTVVNETPKQHIPKGQNTIMKSSFMGLRKRRKSVSLQQRDILKGVNAYFNPGQMIAVMGPSGSGKTTFLDILTGRKIVENPKAKVLINGLNNNETREWFKRHSGYVMQLATPYHEELTVRENLTFSALMRLPKTMSIKNRLWRVEQVIGQASLNDYADVVVGSATGPGLSGGQKRRLCVAIQLLRVPSVLFLDEPTSGLDSASSLELLETLHGLTLSGRLVILTIHQPRIEIFHMFDRILFLCNGKVAYFGSPLMAPTMIAEALKKTDEVFDASNPADTIMDVLINKKSQELIVDFYNKSGEIEAIQEGVMNASKNPIKTLSMKVKRYSSSLADRLLAFDCRASKCQTLAQKLYFLVIFLLYGIALGSVYFQTDSAVLLMSCYQVFTCASQLFMASVIHAHFSKSMAVFSLEQAEGVGKPYEVIIHLFIRIAALSFIPLLLCCVIIYLCTVVQLDVWKFFVTTLIHVQLNHVWIALIMLSACIFPRYSTLICPMLSAVSGFAGGFLVPKPKMPLFYYWLFYINPTHWAYSGIMKMLISDVIFKCNNSSAIDCQSNMGISVLQQFGLDNMDPFDNMLVLFAMLVIFLGLAIFLVEMKYTNKFREFKASSLKFIARMIERVSKIPGHCSKKKKGKDEELKILLSKKDVEANGNCLPPNHIQDNIKNDIQQQHSNCLKSKNIDHIPSSFEDLVSSMLPIRVEPMLTARSVKKSRPNTISAFPSEDAVKHTTISRSHSINYTERPVFLNTGRKETTVSANFGGSEAQLPRVVVSDATDNTVNSNTDWQGRERSDTIDTVDSQKCYSRYLDMTLKPHEVYCAANTQRGKKTRRKSVTKRMPDDVKRSESVHIQRKASMLILAEKRKSMTAQITGFGNVFAYANEISNEAKKPITQRKSATCGVKRKIDAKKHQRDGDRSASTDHLAVPDPAEEELVENVARPLARRSILRSQKAFDYSDDVIIDTGNEDTTKGLTSSHEPRIQYDQQPSIHIGSKRRTSSSSSDRTQQKISESFPVFPKVSSTENYFGDKGRRMIVSGDESKAEPVKVSALKISRKRLVAAKATNEEGPKFSDRYDVDNRSMTCRSSLGSIDELDEEDDDESSVDDNLEIIKARGRLRKSSLQQAQLNTALSKDFSEVTNWLRKNSLDHELSNTPNDGKLSVSHENEPRTCIDVPSRNAQMEKTQGYCEPPTTTGTAKTFSNAVYMIDNQFHAFNGGTTMQMKAKDILHELDSIGRDSLDSEITITTRSNEELTSLGKNESFVVDDKRCSSRSKHAHLRRSNSFESDLEKFENKDKPSNDIVKTRSMRRMNKKLQIDRTGPTSNTTSNSDYDALNETII